MASLRVLAHKRKRAKSIGRVLRILLSTCQCESGIDVSLNECMFEVPFESPRRRFFVAFDLDYVIFDHGPSSFQATEDTLCMLYNKECCIC